MTPRARLLQQARKAIVAPDQGAPLPRPARVLRLLDAVFERQAAALLPGASPPPSARQPPPLPIPPELLGDCGLLGFLHERLQDVDDRRRRGAHFTAPALVREVIVRTLGPVVKKIHTPDGLLELRLCDPAMGAGAFLLEACAWLAARLEALSGAPLREARRRVAERCLRGLDLDPTTVHVARRSLWLCVGDPDLPLDFADETLRVGDALAGERLPFEGAGGFTAFLGNPPWVSYAGRAAQPLAPEQRAAYAERFASFRGYRNLQGLFVERCARALEPGGRLGLILPSSMAELDGYAPVRAEHDRWCEAERGLPDVEGKAFAGVFQPSMVLLSTRREEPIEAAGAPWELHRADLDGPTRALLGRLALPPLPPHLFGERGIQTLRGDTAHLRATPDERHCVPVRAGGDIQAFRRGPASYHADPVALEKRLRNAEGWGRVRVLIRQTARFPIAARADGLAFRNSLLAGFEDEEFPADFLVAYLNSTPIRWVHYLRNRDARLGMPQMKIGHLRALPAPPRWAIPGLAALGAALSAANEGILPHQQAELDRLVGEALGLGPEEQRRIQETRLAPP